MLEGFGIRVQAVERLSAGRMQRRADAVKGLAVTPSATAGLRDGRPPGPALTSFFSFGLNVGTAKLQQIHFLV